MTISKERKNEIIKSFALSEIDTASPEVQCALLTERISMMQSHMTVNKKDFQSNVGLIAMVTQRKKLLRYLKSKSQERHTNIIKKLGLRK